MTRPGKTANEENFPVGSRLIRAAHRPHVRAYYAFARMADDIADSTTLPAEEKLARLADLEAALAHGRPAERVEPGLRLRRCLRERGIPLAHGLDLLNAFRQDVAQTRYADWSALMAYCDRSAAPVGRFLLALHAEPEAIVPASDALCQALQVLNHLQDCGDDYRGLGRIYLPNDWLAGEDVEPPALAATRSSPGLRRVIDRCLDAVTDLLERSRPLPRAMADTRLALETGAIQYLAEDLVKHLRRHDPLAVRVSRTRPGLLWRAAFGAARTAFGRASGW